MKILIAGDSTAANYNAALYPMMGWGQAFQYFTKDDVTVLNFAKGGRSAASFRKEGLWQLLLDSMESGDWVLIQFGHNDQKSKEDTAEEIFRTNLLTMIREVRERGGNVLMLTGVPRCYYNEKSILTDTQGNYPQIVREVAEESSLPLVDAKMLLCDYEKANGRMALQQLYCYPSPKNNWVPEGGLDTSHFGIEGAHKVAKMIADDIKAQQLPLAEAFI